MSTEWNLDALPKCATCMGHPNIATHQYESEYTCLGCLNHWAISEVSCGINITTVKKQLELYKPVPWIEQFILHGAPVPPADDVQVIQSTAQQFRDSIQAGVKFAAHPIEGDHQ